MTDSVKRNLLAAFRYLLKPLVRIAVKNGVAYPEFSSALKHAYVDVARRHLEGTSTKVTAEGICVITHIEQKDVESSLASFSNYLAELDLRGQSALPRILHAWHTDGRFTGPYGVLRDLKFELAKDDASAGEGLTFTDLAVEFCPEFSAKVLIDELLRTRCVVHVGNGYYRATSRFYVPDPLSAESIRVAAQVVHNVCETLELNLRPDSVGGKGLLQRTVYMRNGINKQVLDQFSNFVRARGQIFADDIDDWLNATRDRPESAGSVKTGVGFYQYVVNDEDEQEFSKELPIEGSQT
jgi:hypothetical protein